MSALAVEYKNRLDKLVDEMNDAILAWAKEDYKSIEIAQDASPVEFINNTLNDLREKWQKKFDDVSKKFARMLADRILKHSDVALSSKFRSLGLVVDFQMTDRMKIALESVVDENVGLIRSIPSQYFDQIESLVMTSIGRGRDTAWLTEQLKNRFGATKKRAAFIARDQNNKATSIIQSARQRDIGIKEGMWRHSGAGKNPRKSHQKAGRDRVKFDLLRGAYIDGEYILPGEKPNCSCTWSAVIPGFLTRYRDGKTTGS